MRFSQPSTWAVERKLTRESWQRMKMKWNAWSFIFASCFSLIMCLVEKFWKKMLDLIHQCFFRVRKIATPGKPKDMMVVCCNVRLNDQYFLWSSFSLVEVCLHGSLAKSTISFFFFFLHLSHCLPYSEDKDFVSDFFQKIKTTEQQLRKSLPKNIQMPQEVK